MSPHLADLLVVIRMKALGSSFLHERPGEELAFNVRSDLVQCQTPHLSFPEEEFATLAGGVIAFPRQVLEAALENRALALELYEFFILESLEPGVADDEVVNGDVAVGDISSGGDCGFDVAVRLADLNTS